MKSFYEKGQRLLLVSSENPVRMSPVWPDSRKPLTRGERLRGYHGYIRLGKSSRERAFRFIKSLICEARRLSRRSQQTPE